MSHRRKHINIPNFLQLAISHTFLIISEGEQLHSHHSGALFSFDGYVFSPVRYSFRLLLTHARYNSHVRWNTRDKKTHVENALQIAVKDSRGFGLCSSFDIFLRFYRQIFFNFDDLHQWKELCHTTYCSRIINTVLKITP